MGGAQFWSLLFFTMLITLGLDTMFTFVECMVTALHDHFQFLRKYKELTVVGVCVTCFLFGLSMVSQGGIYMFTLIDSTCASWNIILFALLEVFLVAWMYGMDKWIENFKEMGFFVAWMYSMDKWSENLKEMGMNLWGPIKWYWIICWKFITPGILVKLLVKQLKRGFNVEYGDYRFPDNIQMLGWCLALSSVAMLPLLAIRQIIKRHGRGKKLGFALFKATAKWRPALGAA
jgi:SNF family Na+-dependent transporter